MARGGPKGPLRGGDRTAVRSPVPAQEEFNREEGSKENPNQAKAAVLWSRSRSCSVKAGPASLT